MLKQSSYNAYEIIKSCRSAGIQLTLVDGQIKVTGLDPKQHQGQISQIKQSRDAVIDYLKREAELKAAHADGLKTLTASDFPWADISEGFLNSPLVQNPQTEDLYIAAPMQAGLIFHGLMDDSGANYTSITYGDLVGELDVNAYIRAWQFICQRHDIFRTGFVGMSEKQIHQWVGKSVSLPLLQLDWRELDNELQQRQLQQLHQDDKAKGFDFAKPPLMRLTLVRLADDRHHFLWSHHHVLLDGWCLPIVFKEVLASYAAFRQGHEPKLPGVVPYVHYIAWLYRQDKSAARAFWQAQLQDISAATPLMVDRLPVALPEREPRSCHLALSKQLTEQLTQLAKDNTCTMNVVVQSAWAMLLQRYSNESNVVFGATVSGRPADLPGIEQMMGLFINTLPVRAKFAADMTLADLLAQLHSNNVTCDQYCYLSLADIQALSDIPNGHALFDSVIVYENYPTELSGAGLQQQLGLDIVDVSSQEQTNFALTVMARHQEVLTLDLDYWSDQFAEQTIERMAAHLEALLQAMVKGGGRQKIEQLSLLGADEQRRLLHDWNNTEHTFADRALLQQGFERQAALQPEQVAVSFNGQSLSYAELNSRCNRLAHYLIAQGVKPDTLVGLCFERSFEMLVAIMAVLKAGGAYVPLDPDYPASRLDYIIEDAEPVLLLTQQKFEDLLAHLDTPIVSLDQTEFNEQLAGFDSDNIAAESLGLNADNLCYVLFTSGSTGKPKGVMMSHQAINNRLDWMQRQYPLTSDDKVMQKTPYGFDVSVWELLWAVSVGAQLVFAKPEGHKDPAYLQQLIAEAGITIMHFVPSMLKLMLDTVDWSGCESLKRVFCSGEALSHALVSEFFASGSSAELHNLYGPTEAAIDVSYWDCGDYDQVDTIPIGRPISNIRLYVLDSALNLQPIGAPGELYIGGVGLARGYIKREELTAQSFILNPFATGKDDRLYKTGDLVRWMPDGTLDYLGRIDSQVKIRGFRIELGEIEHQLSQLDAVGEAAVLCTGDNADKRLVGYIVPQSPLETDDEVALKERKRELATRVREQLVAVLPDYMVPSVIVVLGRMPLTGNGKIDRRNLPLPSSEDLGKAVYLAPRNELEQQLVELWQEVLELEQIGVRDSFFALGGHSLLAVRLCSKIQETLQQALPMKALFEALTIEGVAEYLREHKNDEFVDAMPEIEVDKDKRDQPFPLTGVQQAYMLGRSDAFALGNIAAHGYHEFNVAELNFDHLNRAWNRLIARHGVMRAVFSLEGTQRILPEVPYYQIAYVDVREQGKVECRALLDEVREEMSHRVYDVTQWPLFELRVTRIAEQHYRLHYSMDLLLIDGSSARILRNEMIQLYALPDMPLAPIEVSFRDYVLAEQQMQSMPVYQKSKDYWLKRLETLPMAPALPLAKEPSQIKTPKFVRRKVVIPAATWLPYKAGINDLGITPTVFMLTLYSQVLGRWSKSDRLTLNLTLFNRLPLHPQVEQLAGDFTSLTLLEIHANALGSLQDNAKRIQAQLWDDLEHRHFGGTEVLRALNRQTGSHQTIAMPVIFTSALGLGNGDSQNRVKGPQFKPPKHLSEMNYGITQTSQIWLDHVAKEVDGDLHLHWDAIEELFPEGLLDEMFTAYSDLVHSLICQGQSMDSCFRPALSQAQQMIRLEANDTTVERQAQTLHGLFIDATSRFGDNIAVVQGFQTFNYQQVDIMAGALSARLKSLGAKPNRLVAVVMDKGWQQMVATLGIMYSGAAYLPVDGSLPQDRIDQLLAIGEVDIVVTQPHLHDTIVWPETMDLVVVDEQPLSGEAEYYVAPYNPLDLAYVIFTSGSTGQPKGVIIDHRGAANTCIDINQKFNVGSDDRAIGLSALNFDLSVYDLFGLLAVGAAVVLPQAGREKEPQHWVELVEQHGVTLWNTVPALAQLFMEQLQVEGKRADTVRVFLLSGDWLPLSLPDNLRALCDNTQVISLGGATEASIWSIYYPIGEVAASWNSIPYGKPLENQTFHVLKPDLSDSPQWVVGDLYIGGIGVAKGYWKDQEKTAASFIIHPDSGERLYKTGDLGRYLPDGNIEFMGREDAQVKVHGHRIELGEIEAVLAKHRQIHDAVVLAVGENRHNKRLVAYIQPVIEKSAEQSDDFVIDDPQGRYGLLSDGAERSAFKLQQKGLRAMAATAKRVSLNGLLAAEQKRTFNPVPMLDIAALRDMAEHSSIDGERFGQWLTSLAQVPFDDHVLAKRWYPSAGSLYPVQTYCYLADAAVEGIDGGLYYYDPSAHQLVALSNESSDIGETFDAPVSLFLVGDLAAMGPLYGSQSERLMQLEAGHMQQLLRSSAADAGLLVAVGESAQPQQLSQALLLDEQQQVLTCLSVVAATQADRATVQSAGLTLVERQSFRRFLADAVEFDAVLGLLNGVPWQAGYPALYLHLKAQRVSHSEPGFYHYDPKQQCLVPVDPATESLSSNQGSGGGNGQIFEQSAFALYLVGESTAKGLQAAGDLAQALSVAAPSLALGLCPVGNLAFGQTPRGQLLYCLEGGAVSPEQLTHWPQPGAMGKKALESQLRDYLLSQLPVYMAPAAWVIMERLPLTPNGKVNRKALPKPLDSDLQQQAYVAPRNPVEQSLCEIWQDILAVEKVGVFDNFFTLGGHSLLAVRLGTRVHEALGQPLPLKQLFVTPTVAGVAAYLGETQNDSMQDALPNLIIDHENRYRPFELTEVQQAYLLGRSSAFALGNISTHGYSELNLPQLDVERFELAWNRLIEHHGMLRAVFGKDGTQRILASVPQYHIDYRDLRELPVEQAEQHLQDTREALSHQLFNVELWPLFELRVSRLEDNHYRLHFSMDLLLTDASSGRILTAQLHALYQDPDYVLPPLALSFRDYVLTEQAIKQTPLYQKSKDYWLARLDSLPMAPALPLAKDASEITAPTFCRRQLRLNRERWQLLKNQINDLGVTPTVFLLTAFSQVLNHWSKNPQFTLNLTLFNRLPLHDDVMQLVGDFTSLTLLQIDCVPGDTLAQNARRLQAQLWEDLEHRYFGGIEVLRALNAQSGGSQNVTMPVVFTSALGLSGEGKMDQTQADFIESREALRSQDYGITQTSQVWLDHQVSESQEGLVLTWDAIDEMFPAGLLDDMFATYSGLVEGLLDRRIGWQDVFRPALSVTQAERRAAVNATEVALSEQTLHGLFLDQLEQNSERAAIVSDALCLSYGELDRLAGDLAYHLKQSGAQANRLIAVVMHKGWQQVVATLAIQYSGAAYLPIDAALPQQRIDQLLSIGEVSLVVTSKSLAEQLNFASEIEVFSVTEQVRSGQYYLAEHNPDDLAYVIFTSGSTGTPKGVAIDHRGAVNTCIDINRKFKVGENDRVLALSALNFDLSVYDIYGQLAAGGAIVMPQQGKEKDPRHWAELVERYGVTLWNSVPALAQLYIEQLQMSGSEVTSLRLFLMSGDWLPLSLPDAIKTNCPNAQAVSLGGATEASIWSIYYPIDKVESHWKSIPYGKPMSNQGFHVLKADMSDAPDYVVGGLYISGIGLAQGYFKDEAKTRASFIEHPCSGQRLYKTGDLGRYLSDGNIEFMGREDSQVKVHGHRIELGEIEATLAKHERIHDAVVLAVGENRHNKSLVGYIQPSKKDQDGASSSQFSIDDPQGHFGLLEAGPERYMFKLKQAGLRSFDDPIKKLALPGKPDTSSSLQLCGDSDSLLSAEQLRQGAQANVIPLAAFGRWLAALASIEVTGHAIGKRYYPSAGSLYPVQSYLYVKPGAIEQLPSGFYYYCPVTHRLVQTGSDGDLSRVDVTAFDLPFALFLVSDYRAMGPLYGSHTPRFSLLEAGHMAQLLASSAATYDLAVAQDTFEPQGLSQALGLTEHHVLLQTLVGANFARELDSRELPWQARQSYRRFNGESVDAEQLCAMLGELAWQGQAVSLYLQVKDGGLGQLAPSFYRYEPQDGSLLPSDEGALTAHQVSGVNADIFAASSFSLFLLGDETQAKDVLAAGALGQAMSNIAPAYNIGLCPVGNQPFTHLADGSALLYCFEGGAISAQQTQQWASDEGGSQHSLESLLGDFLRARLPAYMVPVTFMVMDQLPLTSNGKVNRKALPLPDEAALGRREYVAPSNELEAKICDIWAELLAVERVGINDNFFELGGNSLLAIKLMNQMREQLALGDVELELAYLFKHPYPAQLAETLLMQQSLQNLELSKQQTAELSDEELESGEL